MGKKLVAYFYGQEAAEAHANDTFLAWHSFEGKRLVLSVTSGADGFVKMLSYMKEPARAARGIEISCTG